MTLPTEVLAPHLVERVLARLGLSDRPQPTLDGLRVLYAAWCRRVPFDNVRKLIHVRAQNQGRLPGDEPTDFFGAWLQHGVGGTCWAGNGGLYSLLVSLGFAATRGIGTMVTSPTVPPNHGTVAVDLEQGRYLVDASILFDEPLLLDRAPTSIDHPAWGVRCRLQEERWHIRWRPLHTPEGIDCRIEHLDATAEMFHGSHEGTRLWSPFNYELSARLLQDDLVVGVAFGRHVTIRGADDVQSEPVGYEERVRLLVEELGMSEEIARRVPPDVPTPPSPWSRTASDFWQEKSGATG